MAPDSAVSYTHLDVYKRQTYEYACKACGEHLEVVQSFKDNALTECPACGGPLRKVFGNIGVAFKGSGFYKTCLLYTSRCV